MSEPLFTWAWTAWQCAQMAKAERQSRSSIILPDSPDYFDNEEEAAIAHFSRLEEGEQVSWLWLFRDRMDAVALKMLPRYLDADDPAATLVNSTLPVNQLGKPTACQLVEVSADWLKTIDYGAIAIQEIWIGFNYKRYAKDRIVRAAIETAMSADEFVSRLKSVV